eukprot:symbB.v1.2.037537.t2/scaffold5565.1/size25819/2
MIMLNGENWKMQAIVWKYLVVSFSNMLSTWCQYESLRYVSLILQTMAKTFKMLPVMLVGMIISKKKHSLQEVCVVTLLTLGLSLFVAGGNVSSENAEGSSFYGICLLMAFLWFDSFTSNFQEKLFKEDNMSKYNQMLYMNLSSALVATSILVFSGMLPYCLAFLDHPGFASHVLMLSLSAAAGQYYIFSMVQSFGALALAAAMNARSFAFFRSDAKELHGQDPPLVDVEVGEEAELQSLVRSTSGGMQSKTEMATIVGMKGILKTRVGMNVTRFEAPRSLGNLRFPSKIGSHTKTRFHETFKHFSDIAEDQFDFHNYCLRKTTLKAYVAMLRMQERLYSHKFYRRAAKDAVKIYLELYDAKVAGVDGAAGGDKADGYPAAGAASQLQGSSVWTTL